MKHFIKTSNSRNFTLLKMSLQSFSSCNHLVTVGTGVGEGGREMLALDVVHNIHNRPVDKPLTNATHGHASLIASHMHVEILRL